MGILYIPEKPKVPDDHRCILPPLNYSPYYEYRVKGAIYQCDTCGKYYSLNIEYGIWEWRRKSKFFAELRIKNALKKQKQTPSVIVTEDIQT